MLLQYLTSVQFVGLSILSFYTSLMKGISHPPQHKLRQSRVLCRVQFINNVVRQDSGFGVMARNISSFYIGR